jgi:DNA mismatch repair protein MutS
MVPPPDSSVPALTPMMQQYQAMRRELPSDVLLFFRLGDFYELFFDDAKRAAPILNVALTKRNGVPMCGVPHHAATGYLAKLIQAGQRVALAEQTSEPSPGKIVERAISQIISASTIDDLNLLDSARSNYLAAVYRVKGRWGLAHLEHSTGDFRLTEFRDRSSLDDELARLRPSETLYSEDQGEHFSELPGALVLDAYPFLFEQATYTLKQHFKVQSLDGFGCTELIPAVGAAGAILYYVESVLRRGVGHLRTLRAYMSEATVQIDAASQANLDLVTSRSGGVKGSLLGAMDRTTTPMGARLLRHWILHPLRDLTTLTERQELVARLVAETFVHQQLRSACGEIRDIERTLSRLSQGSGNARDLKALELSLRQVPMVAGHLEALGGTARAESLRAQLGDFADLVHHLGSALVLEPPATLKEGGLFVDGFSAAIDELRRATTDGKQWIADFQNREQDRSGISSLKIKYNAVFGYFIEVTKSHLDKVPLDYTRKQTVANAERFITPELKEVESKILGADERLQVLEYEEFLVLRETVLEHLDAIQATAAALAELDVLTSFAETARLFGYCRPRLEDSSRLHILQGRHPVLDQQRHAEKFVPNDTAMDPDANRFMLITGPNMAGKSTYIRQVALIVLLAQTGSYVPAASATVGLVDRIFTRVGASDDLGRGQSTFMVEMTETALIANHATAQSLVILDEIGRGTATYDGLSIAWSVVEHLHDRIGCRTLFATHYHELTQLAETRPALANFNVAVREWNEQIIFLRQIVAGAADKSYGIHVARLAGLPDTIIRRAQEILAGLEGSVAPKAPTEAPESVPAPTTTPRLQEERGDDLQMLLFS